MPLNLISVSINGAAGNDASFNPAVTPDGHVIAFVSSASNLVEGDSNSHLDIFRRDQLTGLITRISLSAAGGQADGDSNNPSLAANGNLVAFQSTATNLVNRDNNNATSDIFVKNVVTGVVTLASVNAAGFQSNTPSTSPVLSADGRYVAFLNASPLPNGAFVTDIFVKDLQTGTLTLVSTTSAGGVQAVGDSMSPSFSADGRYLAFVSNADNLVAGDTNHAADVFVRDLVTGSIQRVSLNSSGEQANDHSLDVSISPDGHFVVFSSVATNLVAGTTAYNRDLYVKNLLTGEVVLASVAANGGRANSYSYTAEISADDRFVAFRSSASNLVPGDTNFVDDIFLRDLVDGTTTRVSLTGSGGQGNGITGEAHISADGRLVLFSMNGADFAPGVGSYQVVAAENGAQGADIFAPILLSTTPASGAALVTPSANITLVFNEPVVAGTGSLILTNSAGDTRTIAVASSQIAINGNTVTINPTADLLPGSHYRLMIPENMFRDSTGHAFAGTSGNPLGFTTGDPGDSTAPTLTGASPSNNATGVLVGANITLTFSEPVSAGGGNISILSSDFQGSLAVPASDMAQVTINGSLVTINPTFDLQPGKNYSISMFSGAFVDAAGHAFAGIAEGTLKFTTAPFGTGSSAVVRASLNAQGSASNGDSNDADLSGDGHLVAYENLFTSRINGVTRDIYVKDVTTGALTNVSETAAGVPGNDFSTSPAISNDGNFVVFASNATNLAPTDGNGRGSDVLLKDLTTGAFTLVSTNSNGVAGNADSLGPAISADGHVVAFLSDANNLVSGDNNGFRDVFVKNLQTNALIRANTAANGTQSNGQTNSVLSLSADGQLLAFASNGSNLVAGDTNGAADIFIKTIASGAIVRVNTAADGTQANGQSLRPGLSDDGRFVVFQSLADNLVAGDVNQAADVFVKDLATGAITLVSTNAAGQIGNGGSFDPSISSDGHFVAFSSAASNLVPYDTNSNQDVFVKDLWTGAIRLASHAPGGVQGNDTSYFPTISSNGQVVAFVSLADNLVPNDRNAVADILVRTLNAPDDLDTVSPVLIAATPANGASAVALGNRIFLTFSEAVRPGAGTLILQPANGGPGIVIAADDPGQMTFANDIVVIHPYAALDVATRYNLVIADTAILDIAGNGFAGLAGDALHFTTAAQAVPVVPQASQFVGTAGDNYYIVDHPGDVVTEDPAAGVDTVESLLNVYTLPANVENLVFIGTVPFSGTGNALDNTITGGPGSDALDGATGADHLIGRAGDDLYYVLNSATILTEKPAEGLDSVIAYVTYTLPANVEAIYTLAGGGATGNGLNNLLNAAYATTAQTLDGQGGNDILYGTVTGNDMLIGGSGSDALYGFGGNDTMQGGSGDDAFFIDDAGDVVQENPAEGTDTIYAAVNFTLPVNVEILVPYGAATSATGNGDANVLFGGNGTAGLTLDGKGGDDSIYGSNFADTMIGGAGNDFFWGFLGNDTMQGGANDDVYIVEQAGDVVQENAGEGSDIVYAAVDYTLGANVETLFIYDNSVTPAPTSATGNAADNAVINYNIVTGVTLDGAGGKDFVLGGAGADTIIGGSGIDTLTGSAGNDTFVFHLGEANGDTITDFAGNGAAAGDQLRFLGYGGGETFTNIDATHWQINYNGGASHEIVTFSNAASVHASDVLFV